jgi:hypothetical protein
MVWQDNTGMARQEWYGKKRMIWRDKDDMARQYQPKDGMAR